jgi:hypothetical protein
MSASPGPPPVADWVASVERDIGKSLSEDARLLLRLAVNLGVARAREKNIELSVLASWNNLVGAALLAPDLASRWLQHVGEAFDTNELLPSRPAQDLAKRLANDGKDASTDLDRNSPLQVFSTSALDQLKAAASIAASELSAQPNSTAPPSIGVVRALHIIASMVLQPTGAHDNEAAVGRGDEKRRAAIQAHMVQWVADNAFIFDTGWRNTLVLYLPQAGEIYSLLRPELAEATGLNPKEGFTGWMERFLDAGPPQSDFPPPLWRASGPLGRLLVGHPWWEVRNPQQSSGYPAEWAPLISMLQRAVGFSWRDDLPPDGGIMAGHGFSLLTRALVLADKVRRDDSRTIDLHHLIGAVFAHPGAPLPPAFDPFPVFHRTLQANERQEIRHRFLNHIAQYVGRFARESRNTWTDIILGERLVTARIPTDLSPSEDLLGFGRFANAFASVIADHNVSPPLAIGLFGVWGSGKSAMIDMIDGALADIDFRSSLDDQPRFCRGIVSVRFNAWHYAETNLWASLFVRILEEMSQHLQVNVEPTEQDARDRSLIDLKNAKRDEQRANAEVAEAELAAARAIEEVAKSDQALAAARQAEADVTTAQEEARHAALAAESSRFHALDLAGDAAALLFAFGRPTATELAGTAGEELAATLKAQSQEISEVMDSFKGVSGPLGRLQAILGWRKPILINLIVAGAIAIPLALFGWFAFAHHWFEAIAGSALSAIAIATGAVTTLAPLWARTREALSRAPALLNKLADAAENVRKRAEEREAAEKKAEEAQGAPGRDLAKANTAVAVATAENTRREAATANSAVATARAKADAARQAVVAAETRIADIAPERLLSRFVADRAASEDYGRQLGLPTRIRRDLETLRRYLADLTDAGTATRRADRIVLFIDDLDRCAPEAVVKVLEAVHILLASELFVVVVGVDVRWLTRALATHHASQFGKEGIVEPEDFLEKVFQVPFWIPSMSVEGSRAILKDALPEVRDEGTGPPSRDDGTQPRQDPQTRGGGARDQTSNASSRIDQVAPLPTLEPVDLTPAEHDVLLRWGALAGDTPRRLKRFARSYLILRASLAPTERDAFLENAEFDTVTRLLAFNTADPHQWAPFAAYVRSEATVEWSEHDFGPIWEQLFGEATQPPVPAACRPWLTEVERFGFALWAYVPPPSNGPGIAAAQ